jgi:CO/xanthine dehydrogenase FAD-binding subunit
MKAAQPDALPIAGGTDVMVELNFDRARPEAILDLTRVPELREWGADDGRLRIGAGVTTRASSTSSGDRLPGWPIASRTVGSPQIRNRGTVGGNLGTASPAATRCRRCTSPTPRSSWRTRRRAPGAGGRVRHRPKRNRRARRRQSSPPSTCRRARAAAAVRQDRHAQRDGHRVCSLRCICADADALVRCIGSAGRRPIRAPRPRPSAGCSTGRAVGGAAAVATVERFGELWRRRAADRRRPRQRRLPPPRARCGRAPLAWAWEEQRCA